MDLIVKFYQDKFSRVGVKYLYQHTAVKEYEDLILKLGEDPVLFKLEIVKGKIDAHLISESSGKKISYRALDFKAEQIKFLQERKLPLGNMKFVHVFARKGTLFVAKPFDREQFITISALELINLQGFVGDSLPC